MGKQLKSLQLDHYRSQTFSSIDAHYEAYTAMFESLVEEGNIEKVKDFLRFDSEPFILSNSNLKILQLLLDAEQHIKQNLKGCLASLYLVIGHCYYFSIDFEQAKKYYRLASSFALEDENLSLLSVAMNNYYATQMDELPKDIFWDISKIPAVFLKMGNPEDERFMLVRFITHIELSLQIGKVEYAKKLFNDYFKEYPFEKFSRIDLHVRVLRGKFLFENGRYECAIEVLHEVLLLCMKANSHKDLVQECYKFITQSYKLINEETLLKKMEQYQARFYRKIETDKRYMEKYIKTSTTNEFELDKSFISPLQQFQLAGTYLLKSTKDTGYTLVLVDCKVVENEKEKLNEIIHLINEEMMEEMKEVIITSTRLDESTIGYIIQLSEECTDTLCAKVFYKIREHYPKNESVLEAIYFASVNNKENKLPSYQKCLDLAYAYIYYEIYK
ncbi:dehydrogenase [Solibacillus isronensis]|uniref:dehydrogenase n=1 Tax=Solibacillus isronensis TaxID=412383 RepID=UPI0009A8DE86|nr:dehydrogenase [Solibacillus isronensis]